MGISVSDAPVGRLIDGRYRIESMLAQGGMATVYRALDTRLDRIVALKVMHAELAADDEFVERFIREAHAAAKLSDPNVVAVFDQGEDAGAVYLAMEYVDGQTLRQALREYDRLDVPVALEAIDSILAALSAAHKAGFVHRDVKPENVLISNEGRVKVADFGLARAMSSPGTESRGLLLGTVNYISPDQALGELATARSDVYSAGIVLFEMLTGSVPHAGPTDFVIVRSHIDQDVPPPSSLVPTPPAVDELVRTATARDPSARYADASRFLSAVRRVRGSLDGYDLPETAGAEPLEAAGVGIRAALEEQAAPPPVPPPLPPSNHTRVIDFSAPSAESPMRRADRRDRLEERRRAEGANGGRKPNWRTTVLFVTVLAIALGVAIGAWWMGVGRWENTPSLLELSPTDAQARADETGFTAVQLGEDYSESVEAGLIVSTDPAPGERILGGDQIEYVVSLGKERYEVPNLEGMTESAAVSKLQDLNLKADVSEKYHDTVEKGTVFEQGAEAGEQVRRDTEVSITVSNGPEPITIEDFTGSKAEDATKALGDAGFTVTIKEEQKDDVAPGTVISQAPSSGEGFKGEEIVLTVSQSKLEKVPNDLIGMRLKDAERKLERRGFEVEVQSALPGTEPNERSTVLRTEPGAGTQLARGETVILYVW